MRRNAALLLALLTLACDPLEDEWEELERAEGRWALADVESYAFTFQYGCYCDLAGEFAITVDGDSITSAKRVDDSGPESDTVPAMTVPMMFERIRAGLRRDPHEARLQFDALGYPTDVWFDFEENVADEEWGFGVDEFTDLSGD